MKIPARARLLILGVFAAGLFLVARDVPTLVTLSTVTLARGAVMAVLIAVSTTYPVVMYRGVQSEALAFDEGFLVILALTSPPALTVIVFGTACLAAQLARRRPALKSAFNTGMIVLAAAAGAHLTAFLWPAAGAASARALVAVVAGAFVFWAVNTVVLATLLACLGSSFRASVVDGGRVRGLLWASSVILGVPIGLALSAHGWILPLVVLPFVVLRQVLAGHFQARHDHTRVVGLLESALEINHTMNGQQVEATLLDSARRLLRCADAEVSAAPPGTGQLGEALDGLADKWLVVSGRPRVEPFDDTDRALVATLAAVGSTALGNAALYEDVRLQREQLSILTASLGEAVLSLDREGTITFLNPAATAMLDAVRIGETAPIPLLQAARMAMDRHVTLRDDDALAPGPTGRMLPVSLTASPVLHDDEVTGAVLVVRDMTERKAFEEELARHAFEDALTGLPNRRLFLDHLNLALRRSERSGEVHAVLFVDVDRFKLVNDSLGHHVGDQLLIAIADRLRAVVRAGDTMARLGGDEFVVLINDVGTVEAARRVACKLSAQFDQPIGVAEGREVFVTASIGIAVSHPGQAGEELLRDADVAMYQAKSRGTGRREIFDVAAMGRRSPARIDLEAALRRGIGRGELVPYYQPIVDTSDGSIVGAEALVRWWHPEQGLLLPGSFIGLAEESGLILPLGDHILEESCRQARQWADWGFDLVVNVNLSARQFGQPDLVGRVDAALDAAGLSGDRLTLEIVESLALEDADRTTDVICDLKSLGVRFAIDDFGTGYSSLGYLKQFPVDEVKVDSSFVAGLNVNEVDTVIVRCVTELAAALRMTCVAEGVETQLQLAALRKLGCPAAQGHLFSQALPAGDFAELLGGITGRRELAPVG